MSFNITVPSQAGEHLNIDLAIGETLFVLGPNGAGKSALVQKFFSDNSGKARRISAHRQTWLSSGSLSMSPQNRRYIEKNVQQSDSKSDSRWKDQYAEGRVDLAIYDLINSENVRARTIAKAVDQQDYDSANNVARNKSPIAIINDLLRLSNMQIEIFLLDDEHIVASKNGGLTYSIAELSDGERNALLIAVNVLTADEGTLVIIDEPERHLHRSIISPLLSNLLTTRPDCSFVISTHDTDLVLDNPSTHSLLVRGCTFLENRAKGWDADLIPTDLAVDESLLKDILGSRRTLLFIEGNDRSSLDKPLYSLMFPNISILARGSCRDVEHAVLGIRNSASFHWIKAFGIIDSDNRVDADINRLRRNGVYPLNVHSVESLYYSHRIIRRIAMRQADVTGEDSSSLIESATNAALSSLSHQVQRLSERAVEKSVRSEIDLHWPKLEDVAAGRAVDIRIDIAGKVQDEVNLFQGLLSNGDIEKIICRYPLRETGALNAIALKLGFQSRSKYEAAVIKLLIDDDTALNELRSLFADLVSDMNAIT